MTDKSWNTVLKLSVAERIYYLHLAVWWPLKYAIQALNEFEDLMAMPDDDRPRCILLVGESNIGKTRILKELLHRHPPARDATTGTLRKPVLFVETPIPPTPEELMYEILCQAGLVPSDTSLGGMVRYAAKQLPNLGILIVLLDELQRIKESTSKECGQTLEVAKLISGLLRRPVVVSGTPELQAYFQRDSQLQRRFRKFELPVWQPDSEAQQLVHSILENMPLREGYSEAIYQDMEIVNELIRFGEGVTGGILAALQDATKEALREGEEYLTTARVLNVTARISRTRHFRLPPST